MRKLGDYFEMKIWPVLACVSVFLTGCQTGPLVSFSETRAITEQGYATIQYNEDCDTLQATDKARFIVEDVSGPFNTTPLPPTNQANVRALKPGANTLKIRVNEQQVIGQKITYRVGFGELDLIAAPHTAYGLTGTVNGDIASVWITEIYTFKKVSDEIQITLSRFGEEKIIRMEIPIYLPPPSK